MSGELGNAQAHARALRRWLDEDALPLWADRGVDPDWGFVERMDHSGNAVSEPVRARVVPRQIYVYAEAGLHHWNGDWRSPVEQALDRLTTVYRRGDGLYGNVAGPDGLIDDRFDLYNHAFVLLALASAAKVFLEKRGALHHEAVALLSRLKARFSHPIAGFEESEPPTAPLKSNPHMHLFEAAQVWTAVPDVDTGAFAALADEIASLATRRFINAETGALREFFGRDWLPMPDETGRIVEPGHQFEWAWLLARHARGGVAEDRHVAYAARLFDIGETHGVDTRGVAFMALDDAFGVVDPIARLWAQTEWLKAASLLAAMCSGRERERYLASAARAASALRRFLETPVSGLWFDKMRADGSFVDEPAPASSFYHIACAIYEFEDRLGEIAGARSM
ncbi:AGE family epimerase/isomerase [Rhizobium sp. EC-SD404]|uniref:AGE family epimerase/isomerase n=1 Tax=Rhizobium sp. EC-SD404 TaxID=2038389 RepID=UPI0012550484|nr:AGE family epimerase/isomerase [Rhizobium sp. EC-SD404]VVT30856.1 Mannose-6-phosphate isomerase [Rhizobium sp. EC-SD404]